MAAFMPAHLDTVQPDAGLIEGRAEDLCLLRISTGGRAPTG